VEHKRFAVAVHYRNVAAERVAEMVAAAHHRGRQHGLRMTNGRKVIELRPNVDWDKGTALRWISDSIYRSGRVVPIYIGDDLTDEDAFDARWLVSNGPRGVGGNRSCGCACCDGWCRSVTDSVG
jgi:trehalose-phosphatase